MPVPLRRLAGSLPLLSCVALALPALAAETTVQVGPRPHFLVQEMAEGALEERLLACAAGPFQRTDFSIAHRGAPLQFPEHNRQSYEAAAVMVLASRSAT